MPKLLLISANPAVTACVQEVAQGQGFEVQLAPDAAKGLELARGYPFEAAVVDGAVQLASQQELAAQLWKQNALAVMVVFDAEGKSALSPAQVRMYGAEIARGPDAPDMLKRILESVKPRKVMRKEDLRIMVVEDLDSPRDIICAFIESIGYSQVKGFGSVREALKELENHPKDYSCIVTDMRMPVLSGQDLIEYVRREELLKHLPIIVLTAFGTLDCLIECLKAGASGFLVKPPKKDDLNRELSRALRIVSSAANPRLTSAEDAETIRELFG